jgi:hypothetical protein
MQSLVLDSCWRRHALNLPQSPSAEKPCPVTGQGFLFEPPSIDAGASFSLARNIRQWRGQPRETALCPPARDTWLRQVALNEQDQATTLTARGGVPSGIIPTRAHLIQSSSIPMRSLSRISGYRSFGERPHCAKSCPSLTIIIYVRNIFGLATKEASHPSMMETSRATTSAVPPTADIVGDRGHV